MLHVVKPHDSLLGIAKQHGIIVDSIMESNVICNPNYIYIGQPLIISEPGLSLPKAGGTPYYVVNYGDTIGCLAKQFGKTVYSLGRVNKLKNSNEMFHGMELLVTYNEHNNLQHLFQLWNTIEFKDITGRIYLAYVEQFEDETFSWESFGEKAAPYLMELLNHQNSFIRYYAVKSLGRIGKGNDTFKALQKALKDSDSDVLSVAQLALKRYQLIPRWTKRIHIVLNETKLLSSPHLTSSSISIARGTPVFVSRWYIPSPTQEINDFTFAVRTQIYDQIQVVETGAIGYLPRDYLQTISLL
ncbi:LysM peptidoglycan-binding domain-containing protein [Priestia megaterium]|uniref:LysM peptidoglycan-binding domain-containing protein n=1 Tax=Priestia megaterium TaxID=1404 RepID=UPI0035B5D85D